MPENYIPKTRLEAFSDGVIAIIITIMVLEFKVPHGSDLESLKPLLPTFLIYVISFIFLGIYWNNHHHLLHAAKQINGKIMWANLHLLFWLSLVPFVTGWMGETHFSVWSTAFYGIDLLFAAIAYYILVRALLAHHGKDSFLASAIGNDFKGKISIVLYLSGICLSFLNPMLAFAVYVFVALMWLIPDQRIEKVVS